MPQAAQDILKSVFGFDAFRPGQEEIVSAILGGEDVLAILPTGGGKSLLYQLPAVMREGLTLVVSPLVALMRDQVEAMRRIGVAAGALSSANDPHETEAVFEGIDAGTLRLLYLAPERLSSAEPLLRRAKPRFVAVDEAHCVSQWGHDFRPDYLKIGPLRERLGNPQLAAFTATADEATRGEIAARLFAKPPHLFLRGFDRPNLRLAFAAKREPRRQLLDFVVPRKDRSGIVYAASRSKTEVLAEALRAAGVEALPYHAGLDAETRRIHQDRFQREDGVAMCATIAFGMGVDKPDIRWVAHADLPKSLESWWQEIGRAGRDGAPAETLTLWGLDDVRLARQRIDEGGAPAERKRADHARLDALLAVAEAPRCRRLALLGRFGEAPTEPCGNCDLCENPPKLIDGTEAAQMALSAVWRTEERYGVEHLVAVLRGEETEKVTRAGHDRLKVFGRGADRTKDWWRDAFRQFLALGLVEIDAARHGAWRLTAAARPVLRGEQSIELRAEPARPPRRSDRSAPAALVKAEDEELFARLRALRARIASEIGGPAYLVFSDRSLIDIAEKRPRNPAEFALCHGVGAQKLAKFGPAFLGEINGEAAAPIRAAEARAAAAGAGAVLAELEAAHAALLRGADGTEKYLTLTRATLAKIAEARPGDMAALERISGVGPQKAERFGPAFLSILAASG